MRPDDVKPWSQCFKRATAMVAIPWLFIMGILVVNIMFQRSSLTRTSIPLLGMMSEIMLGLMVMMIIVAALDLRFSPTPTEREAIRRAKFLREKSYYDPEPDDTQIDAAAEVLFAEGKFHGWFHGVYPPADLKVNDPIAWNEFTGIAERILRAAREAEEAKEINETR